MALVKLKLGNLFDEPTDLVVLPCSTGGTITNFVANSLREYEIPHPKQGMGLGEIDVQPLVGAENIAQYAAFAVSVKHMSSDIQAIKNIGKSLCVFARKNSAMRRASAPLLGAGAGGLRSEDVVSSLSSGFKETAPEDAVLTIFVLHKEVVDRLRKERETVDSSSSSKSEKESITPRVFVSYSGASPVHKTWIKDLATYLRSNGIDARLDQWHLRGGMDLPQWMANELQMADRVVIITDNRYTERADGRVGGVGWETMLIQGDMSSRPVNDNRYIVVVKEDHFSIAVPRYLKTKYCMHWSSDADESELQIELLKELFNVEKAPPIGEPPVFV